jgi:hypothetical protein
MMHDRLVVQAGVRAAAGFDLVFALDGDRRREGLASCWNVPFERAAPARGLASYRGQRNFPGWWYFSRTKTHVGFESWLERDHVMAFDADPEVVAVSSQPFWLHWSAGGRERRHAPDFFVRLRSGDAVVVDVRPDDRIEPADAEAFAVTERACAAVGWRYRRVGTLDAVLAANLRWLSGCRHSRCRRPDHVTALREVFARPRELLVGVREVGDPVAVLPVLFHLLWTRELGTDLTATVLGSRSLVSAGGGRR